MILENQYPHDDDNEIIFGGGRPSAGTGTPLKDNNKGMDDGETDSDDDVNDQLYRTH